MDLSVFTQLSPQSVLLWILVVSCLIQLWFYLVYFSRLTFYKKKAVAKELSPVSVIICARNEAKNLKEFLPFVLEQDYPVFEVIVVNDCSSDVSEDILREFSAKYNHLKIVDLKAGIMHEHHGKKLALMMGIKGANYENLVFTDADCKPNATNWLQSMSELFVDKTEIILGYGGYEKQAGLLNKMIRYDTFIIAVQYLSLALAKKTYMGIGRNLAYKKELFFKMKGFASHVHITSGDDDLFVNEATTKTNTVISLDTKTTSRVTKSWSAWKKQKLRHLTTYSNYTFWSRYRLKLLTGSQYVFFISIAVLLSLQIEPLIVLGIFSIRFIIQLLVFIKPLIVLNEKDLFFFFPFMEIILLVAYPLVSISKVIGVKNGRRQ